MQADMENGGILVDVTQLYDPTIMDIILPWKILAQAIFFF